MGSKSSDVRDSGQNDPKSRTPRSWWTLIEPNTNAQFYGSTHWQRGEEEVEGSPAGRWLRMVNNQPLSPMDSSGPIMLRYGFPPPPPPLPNSTAQHISTKYSAVTHYRHRMSPVAVDEGRLESTITCTGYPATADQKGDPRLHSECGLIRPKIKIPWPERKKEDGRRVTIISDCGRTDCSTAGFVREPGAPLIHVSRCGSKTRFNAQLFAKLFPRIWISLVGTQLLPRPTLSN